MFYQADKIDSILICDVCDSKMVDPRLLPCGKSVCNRCVDLLFDTGKERIKCQNCAKTHEIPEEGFLKNLALQKLLEFENKEDSRSNLIEEFKKVLEILKAEKKSIESTLECGDAKIRDHCDKVRNDMQFAIEQADAKLDEFHKEFMDEIDNHEKECQAKFKSIKQNKVDIEKALNESNELLSKSDQLLKQFKIDQTESTTLFERAHSLLTKLETNKDRIQKEMFNESLLKFDRKKSFDSNVVGKIVKQNIELYFLENIEKMREIKNVFPKTIGTGYYQFFQPFKSNTILLLYIEKNILNLLCLDKDGNTVFDKKDLLNNEELEEFIFFNFLSSKCNKTVYVWTGEKHLKQTNTFYNLRSFDENFNLLAKIKLDKRPNYYDVNGEDLFLLDKHENFCTISMYNQNLEIIQKFGQENSTVPFYFSTYSWFFLVSNQYFIIKEPGMEDDDVDFNSNVLFINRSNGLVEGSFKIYENFRQMQLYLDKFLITFSPEATIKCYNFKGDLLHQVTLDKKFKGTYMSVLNKKLCFCSEYNKIII
jgi:hypothetical protein